ncbi:DUF2190 family protein [Pseudooceanicola sp. C21-150M6]|uniref:DUF2190 family protein n=1 Tax=Pseudooceanicola sp. C21-150M6 TaxID=3434355 RepID=UPI003D7F9ADF
MRNYIQEGKHITITAAATASAGDGVLIGSLFGIACGYAAIGDDLDLATVGVFDMPKLSTAVFAVGDPVYWDDAESIVTDDDNEGGNSRVGIAVTTAANPSASVNVRLDG